MALVIDTAFWERVRRATEGSETTAHEVVAPLDEIMVGTPLSPVVSPISPASSPHGPTCSPITPPEDKQLFSADPHTAVDGPRQPSIAPPKHEQSFFESQGLVVGLQNARETDAPAIATVQAAPAQAVRRRNLLKSNAPVFNIHEDFDRDILAASQKLAAETQPLASTAMPTPTTPPTSSSTSRTSSLSSTSVPRPGTLAKKHLKAHQTAAMQPVYSATSGAPIDPVTSHPYRPNEIITPPTLHDGGHTKHGSPTRTYMNSNVTPVLLEGMRIIAKEKPKTPLMWLGRYLTQKSRELETEDH